MAVRLTSDQIKSVELGEMRTMFTRITVLAAFVAVFGTSASVFAQASQSSQLAAAAPQTRRLTADEAVRLALENNLGIQVARFNPQIEDLNSSTRRRVGRRVQHDVLRQQQRCPEQNFLSGAQGTITSSDQVLSNVGVTADAAVGRQLQRRLGQLALQRPTTLLELLAAAQLVARR